jgi:hypothetical protein
MFILIYYKLPRPTSSLKVPKCEIFDLMASRDFYPIKPLWVGDFWTVIQNSKLFHFGHDFKVFSANILS